MLSTDRNAASGKFVARLISIVESNDSVGEDTSYALVGRTCTSSLSYPEYRDVKPTGNAQAATFDFLQPPRAADEMGRLGPYRILRVVGAGSMGVVFLAEDTRVWRQVALKALKPNVPNAAKARQRFLREGQATADLKHDHVITIHDVGQVGDVPYLAMEYLQGESLAACLKRDRRLAFAEVLRVGRETADGLDAAHRHGLVHRDVKPSNLWLEGKRRRVKVLDFGLARQTASEQTNLTQAGVIVGTPSYMSPEQAKGEALDARADLFSLGCVLYRMSTGVVPFKGKDTVSTLMALAMDPPIPPVQHRPDLPVDLNHLILRLLAKQPNQRPPSAEVVVRAIRALEQPPVNGLVMPVAKPVGPDQSDLAVDTAARVPRKPLARKRGPAALVVGGAALLVLALLLVVFVFRPSDGTVRLDTEDRDLEIALLDQGREVAVLDRKSKPAARLKPGEYLVEIRKARDGLRLTTERVLLKRGGDEVLRVVAETVGYPLAPSALVASPPRLVGLESWTLESRLHRGTITALALSGDGTLLATGGDDGTVRVWPYPEVESANPRILLGLGTPVIAVNWSKDGKTLAVYGQDKKAYLWDLYDPNYAKREDIQKAAPEKTETTYPVANGNKLALTGGRVVVLDATGKEIRTLPLARPAASPVQALAVAPDGKTIAAIHADQSLLLWEANSGKLLHVLKAADPPKHLLAWSPNGKTLATSHGTTVRLWDVETGTEAKNFASGPVNALAWSPDGKTLALLGTQLQFWDAEADKLSAVKTGAGVALAWSNDGKAVMVGVGNTAEIWDLKLDQARLKCERPANAGPVVRVAWSPDGKIVAEADTTGTRLYDPKTGKLLNTLATVPPAAPLGPLWAPDRKTFLCGSVGKPELRDTTTYKIARPVPGVSATAVAWSPDGRTLALATTGNVRLVSAETGKPRGMILAPGTPDAVFVLATGHYRTATANENEVVYVTQSDRGQQTLTPADFARAHAWKNDPRWVRFNER